jgi:hypothetical protein
VIVKHKDQQEQQTISSSFLIDSLISEGLIHCATWQDDKLMVIALMTVTMTRTFHPREVPKHLNFQPTGRKLMVSVTFDQIQFRLV